METLNTKDSLDSDKVEVQEKEQELMMDITDDMYCGSLPDDLVSSFTCMLCYGVVFNPIKCARCETLFCGRCVPEKRKLPGKFRCYNKCGSKNCHKTLNKQE